MGLNLLNKLHKGNKDRLSPLAQTYDLCCFSATLQNQYMALSQTLSFLASPQIPGNFTCVGGCPCIQCAWLIAIKARKGHQIPSLELETAVSRLGIKLWSSGKVRAALKHWTIFPGPLQLSVFAGSGRQHLYRVDLYHSTLTQQSPIMFDERSYVTFVFVTSAPCKGCFMVLNISLTVKAEVLDGIERPKQQISQHYFPEGSHWSASCPQVQATVPGAFNTLFRCTSFYYGRWERAQISIFRCCCCSWVGLFVLR